MPGRRHDHLDEDSVRVRPGRGSRPRTKERPAHAAAVPAQVVAVDRGRYTCRLLDDPSAGLIVSMRARELGRSAVVVGDRVALVGDTAGGRDALARVVRVEPRSSALRRTADDDDPAERVVVANADQMVIVTALAQPRPRTRLVDRCLVAAYAARLKPLLCLTKADLAESAPLLELYRALEVPTVVTGRRRAADGDADAGAADLGAADLGAADLDGLGPLRARLAGATSVFVGSSGAGKSTLVNALVPGSDRRTGQVNAVTGRGRHVSTSAVALLLPEGGWVVDTPGIRSFGLAHVAPGQVLHAFPDLEPGTRDCPRACSHDEPDCALDGWVGSGAAGASGPARLASLRRLISVRPRQPGD